MEEKIENIDFEEKTNFIENLNHQITQKYRFFKSIPFFNEKVDELNFKMKLKESIFEIRKKYEDDRYRKSYESLINEFKNALRDYKGL
jgi:hypothetical protein